MKPNFKILADGVEVDFSDKLLSLTLNDNEGYKNDTLTIVLDDRNNIIDLPKTGVELDVWLGYGNDLHNKGAFEVDSVKVSGMPETLTITAKGSKINGSLKIRRTQTYQKITLNALLETVAKRSGMTAKVSSFLRDIEIEHINQVDQSDQDFLSKLKRYYDAEFKTISSNLIFYQKDDFKTTSDEALETIIIDKSDCSRYDFEQTDRTEYNSVIASWRDVFAAKVKKITIGSAEPVFIIKELFANEEEARGKATTKFNDLQRGKISGDLTCVGNPKIAGEFEIKLTGFRSELQTNFKCVSSVHRIENGGYSTTLKVVNKK